MSWSERRVAVLVAAAERLLPLNRVLTGNINLNAADFVL